MVTQLRKHDSGDDYHLWRFVTNHAHVLSCIAANPNTRLRDIAQAIGITERTVGQIISQLEEAGYLTKTRVGRRNQYEVHGELPLRHPEHHQHTVGDLLEFLQAPSVDGSGPRKQRHNHP